MSCEPARVMVLDGETRKGLAVVRSLGKMRLSVGVVSSDANGIAIVGICFYHIEAGNILEYIR